MLNFLVIIGGMNQLPPSSPTITPPALIDRLCEGVPLPFVCRDAIFAEELIEVAKKLGRAHHVTFEKCDP